MNSLDKKDLVKLCQLGMEKMESFIYFQPCFLLNETISSVYLN